MIAKVLGVGARSQLGLSSLQVVMGLRAGAFEPRSVRIKDSRGDAIGIALTGGLAATLYGYNRLVTLAAPALSEAVHELPDSVAPSEETPIPLVLCVAEASGPHRDPRWEQIIAAIASRSGVHLDEEKSQVIDKGQPGFAHAIEAAKALLDGGSRAVVVGGVDSYYDPDVLASLDAAHRLDCLGNDDGLTPSEGAAFLVLARVGTDPLGKVIDVATAEETSVIDDDEPNVADAMTDLLITVQERSGKHAWAISDINGERHRTSEWLKASDRTLPHPTKLDKWVWEMGDMGAALGPMFAVCVLKLCELGKAPDARALLALHAEGVDRGVVCIEGRAVPSRPGHSRAGHENGANRG